MIERAAPLSEFGLDPTLVHWNHGSFGACPRAVLVEQAAIRQRLESGTMRYFVVEYEPALAAARAAVGQFLDADADGCVFVPNATTGVATALANVVLAPGDEIVTTDHGYRACRNALDRVAAAAGARVIVASIPLPLTDANAPVAAILARVGPRTRLVLCDHVTSPTAIVIDIAALARGLPSTVALLVDGAHAPGMVPLSVAKLGATYYAANLHKWTCAPKGAGVLWVAPDHRDGFRPLVTSHGATEPLDGTTRFRREHDWTGTIDPSPYLCAPIAIDTIAALGGGWPAVRARGHALALAAAAELSRALSADPIVDPAIADRALGAMAAVAVELPPGATPLAVQRALIDRGIEVPIVDHPASPWPLVRISAHLYNTSAEIEPLAFHLRALGVTGRTIA